MTCADERIVGDISHALVDLEGAFSQILVENGRQERVGEANRPVLALEHLRGDRRPECVRRYPGALEGRLRGRADRSCERECVARGRRETREPHAQQFLQGLGDGQRLERIDLRLDETGQLQREERVPARALVDAEEGLAAERSAEAVEQQPLERTDAQRLDVKVLETLCGDRVLELRRPYALGRAAGQQDDDGFATIFRNANTRACTDEASSHWTSSTASSSRPWSASSSSDSRTATARARRSTGSPAASSSSSATSSALCLGADSAGSTSSRTPSKRSLRPA
jgi:hypothetical protein